MTGVIDDVRENVARLDLDDVVFFPERYHQYCDERFRIDGRAVAITPQEFGDVMSNCLYAVVGQSLADRLYWSSLNKEDEQHYLYPFLAEMKARAGSRERSSLYNICCQLYDDMVADGDPMTASGKRGKIAKRIFRYFRNRWKIELPENLMGAIGAELGKLTHDSMYIFVCHSPVMREMQREFGDRYSCFWDERSYDRYELQEATRAGALLLYNSKGAPYGRCWYYDISTYPTARNGSILEVGGNVLLFNAYSHNGTASVWKMVRALFAPINLEPIDEGDVQNYIDIYINDYAYIA